MSIGLRVRSALMVVLLTLGAAVGAPTAKADNKRLNNTVFINIYTMQQQAGCKTDPKVDGRLADAARTHAVDAADHHDINGDDGSDGSTPQTRARDAGFVGNVAETVATNPALSITAIEILAQWYYDPPSRAIIENCANTAIGVWTENRLDRTVVVAMYGQPG